jgi:hypothetical protein
MDLLSFVGKFLAMVTRDDRICTINIRLRLSADSVSAEAHRGRKEQGE